jgi:hypothetical protein
MLFKLNILYTIGKLLKLKYLKWSCFLNSSYEQKFMTKRKVGSLQRDQGKNMLGKG